MSVRRLVRLLFPPVSVVLEGPPNDTESDVYWWRAAVLAACDDAAADVLEALRHRAIDIDEARRRLLEIRDFFPLV